MKRIQQLLEKLSTNKIDALLITNPLNRRYITGFTGTAGVAIVSEQGSVFITDFRYTKQAEEQISHFEIVEHEGPIQQEVKKQLDRLDIQTLGFEKDDVTYALYENYQQSFNVELVPISQWIEEIRFIKSEEELEMMQKAADIADQAFAHILSFIKPGVREIEVANELEFFMRKQGATSSSFDIIVASGERSALPHGVASNKKIQSGELVTMDYGALYNGYCSDITRTVAVGEVSDQLREIYDIVLRAQENGVEKIKPGMTGSEADALTRDIIASEGYGEYFGHSTGHGLGLEVHEEPRLAANSQATLEPGMVVTVEPGIYIPNVGGCRIEDDIVITETGNRRLTNSDKSFKQLI